MLEYDFAPSATTDVFLKQLNCPDLFFSLDKNTPASLRIWTDTVIICGRNIPPLATAANCVASVDPEAATGVLFIPIHVFSSSFLLHIFNSRRERRGADPML